MMNNNINDIIKELGILLRANESNLLRTLTVSALQVLPESLKKIVTNCYNENQNSITIFCSEQGQMNFEIEKLALQQFFQSYYENETNQQLNKEKLAFQTSVKQILIVSIILDEIYQKRILDETYIYDLMNQQDKFIIDDRIIKIIDLIFLAKKNAGKKNIQQQQQNILEKQQQGFDSWLNYDIEEDYENDSKLE